MTILVTGSAGHLGEAVMRTLRSQGRAARGVDVLESPWTDRRGDLADRGFVAACMDGVTGVIHAATLHKPHVATHSRQRFVDVNVTGTLNLLEEAVAAGVEAFVFTSTTSVFGKALSPPPGAPAVWVTEALTPVPKNIYGVTKTAAEDLCQLMHQLHGLPCLVLRTSRFFPEADDSKATRDAYDDANAKVNEFLYRRVDLEDVVQAHLLALERAPDLGFDRFIVSATTPFTQRDLAALRDDAPGVVARVAPEYAEVYAARGWRMFPEIGRVYVNARARERLGWRPRHDFRSVVARVAAGQGWRSPLVGRVGSKGYHAEAFEEGPYPVDS